MEGVKLREELVLRPVEEPQQLDGARLPGAVGGGGDEIAGRGHWFRAEICREGG